jgi:SAM-dependent methyltransferase
MSDSRHTTPALEYLCVDDFLKTLIDAQVLKTAFDLQLIDHLQEGASGRERLEEQTGADPPGLRFLLGLLQANGVLLEEDGRFMLTPGFQAALRYRDLLVTKLRFANLAAADFLELSTPLATRPEEFARRARIIDLFAYNRCLDPTPENLEATRRWMQITTVLTRYEAAVCMQHHDFAGYGSALDIGGNSGEFVLQLCRAFPGLEATVLDLPVVCEVGREHVSAEPEAARIRFQPGNAMEDPLPGGCDLILFKSMLHDWPDPQARQFLSRACDALTPGGTLLIFERSAIETGAGTPPYSLLPMLLFLRYLRTAAFYEKHLKDFGLQCIATQHIALDTSFLMVAATKP